MAMARFDRYDIPLQYDESGSPIYDDPLDPLRVMP
jgi:hypothetical protein